MMTAVYLCMLIFSQFFHTHSAFSNLTSLSAGKEKKFEKNTASAEETGCIWCHQLLESPLLPAEQRFDFSELTALFARQIFAFAQRFSTLTPTSFYLRGPPQHFI